MLCLLLVSCKLFNNEEALIKQHFRLILSCITYMWIYLGKVCRTSSLKLYKFNTFSFNSLKSISYIIINRVTEVNRFFRGISANTFKLVVKFTRFIFYAFYFPLLSFMNLRIINTTKCFLVYFFCYVLRNI